MQGVTCPDIKETAPPETDLRAETNPAEQIERRLDRYHKAKMRSKVVANYILASRPDLLKIGQDVKQCGDWLIFRHFYTVGLSRMIGGCSCKRHLLCMLCAIRRAAKQMMAYTEKVDQILKATSGLKLALISLTVKNGPDLDERFSHLVQSIRTIAERRRNSKKKCTEYTVFTQLEGAVYTYEVTNKGNQWHPHIHILALVPEHTDLGFVDSETGKKTRFGAFQDALIEEWKEITGDSMIVDAREIGTTEDSRIGAFCEVFKYALKQTEMSTEHQVQAYDVLRGKRLTGSFGLLYGVDVPEGEADTIEAELALLPYVDMLYRHSQTFGYQLHAQFSKPLPLEEAQFCNQ